MKSFIINHWKLLLSTLFGIGVFLFWYILYPHHLLYNEQFQMFLFSTDYFLNKISLPGGLSLYIAEFFTQFYLYPLIGAIIITVLLLLLQGIVWRIIWYMNAFDEYYPLSFIPSISTMIFLCDENSLLSFLIATIISVLFSLWYLHIKKRVLRIIFIIICTLPLYWICGPVSFIFVAFAAFFELYYFFKEKKKATGLLYSIGILLYGLLFPLLSSLVLQYPLDRIMIGINYYRFPEYIPISAFVTILLVILLPFISPFLHNIKNKKAIWIAAISTFIAGIGIYSINKVYDKENEEIMMYDQMARNKQWNEIIKQAEFKSPTSPMSVTCLNLALGMKGQLSERMFEFYQNGTEGLIGNFKRHFSYILPSSEVFYNLGMINSAQRFTFEAMEAIPDYRKSVRCYKRLAETNLINGQYKVAEKYLRTLSKTLFYKDWAENTMQYLNNEKKIDAHSEWGKLRKYRYTNDFLFSEKEVDTMFGLLFTHNSKNKMAFEYMLAYVLEQRDIAKFSKYFPLIQNADYKHIPKSYQEALVYSWTQSHKDFKGMPWEISPLVMNNISGFARIYFSGNNTNDALKYSYGNTYWYYLLCKQ